jgi:hypothetical protein
VPAGARLLRRWVPQLLLSLLHRAQEAHRHLRGLLAEEEDSEEVEVEGSDEEGGGKVGRHARTLITAHSRPPVAAGLPAPPTPLAHTQSTPTPRGPHTPPRAALGQRGAVPPHGRPAVRLF